MPHPRAQDVRRLCQNLKPIIGKRAEQLFQAYQAEDDEGKNQIQAYLEILASQLLPTSLDRPDADLIPPSAADAAGDYPVGQVVYAGKPQYDFAIREDECIQHIACFGRTGAGKTNLGFILFDQFHRQGKPVLVFDWKRNYRDLLALPEYKDVEVYTIGGGIAPLTFNPLVPPAGTKPKTWLKKIIQVIAHAYMLGNGTLYMLQQTLDAVYEEYGVYDHDPAQGPIQYPTFRDLLNKLKRHQASGREAGWLSSTLRALASLCFGDMDTLVNQGNNQVLDHLLKKPVILELDALTQSDKVFFIQALLLWIHHRRMAEGEREQFKHAVFIEEAHHVLSNERYSLVGGQSVMDLTFREIREFGECLVLFDQHPSQISLPALGNTYTTICLNLKHGKDVSTMAQAMLLDGEQKDLLGSLRVGEAIVKVQGRVPRPFMIHIPEFAIRKGRVDDAAVACHMRPILQQRGPFLDQTTNPLASPLRRGSVKASEQTPLQEIEAALLQDVQAYPASGVAARYKRLGISVRQGQKLKARLLQRSLVAEQQEHTKTGRLNRLILTEAGSELLARISPPEGPDPDVIT